MKPGTKTILFGTHQFILHPLFVLIAWVILYKRLPKFYELLAIITHDLGYWGQPNIDGHEGEKHPEIIATWWSRKGKPDIAMEILGHSRFYAKRNNINLSKLFYADKFAVSLYPTILYLVLAYLSGEIHEYIYHTKSGKYNHYRGNRVITWWYTTKSKMCLMGLGEYGDTFGKIQENVAHTTLNT